MRFSFETADMMFNYNRLPRPVVPRRYKGLTQLLIALSIVHNFLGVTARDAIEDYHI
jgi:hypothetical protein